MDNIISISFAFLFNLWGCDLINVIWNIDSKEWKNIPYSILKNSINMKWFKYY